MEDAVKQAFDARSESVRLGNQLASSMMSDDLDGFTKLLIWITIISIMCEVFFLVLPYFVKSHISALDHQKGISGYTSLIFCVWTGICKTQQYFNSNKSKIDKLKETHHERTIRLRSTLTMELHLYVLLTVASVWLTINIVSQITRN